MRKNYFIHFVLLASCLLLSSRSLSAQSNCYTQLYDGSGYPVERHHGQLNAAACALIAAFPREYQDSFQVYDFGFYLHNEVMAEGLEGIFQKEWSSIPNKSKYHLIFGKQSDRSGIYTKLWVELKLPTQGSFICLSSDMAGKVAEDIQSVSSHYLTPGNLSSYVTAEAETMKWLQQLIQEATDCCQGSNLRSSEECVFSGLGRKNYYQFNNKRYYTGDTLFVPRQDRVIKLPAFLENGTPFKAPMTTWKGASAGIGSDAVGEFRTNVTSKDATGIRISALQTTVFQRIGKADSIVIDSVGINLVAVSTKFIEPAFPIYGYDENNDTTEFLYPSYQKGIAWKSIANDGSYDEFTLQVEPKSAAKKVKLFLSDSINFKLDKKQAANFRTYFKIATTVTSIFEETEVKPIVDGIVNDSATLKVKSYDIITKNVSIVIVNEKSDDFQIIPKDSRVNSPSTRIISWGRNRQIETNPLGDDKIVWDATFQDSVIVAGTNLVVETIANDSVSSASNIHYDLLSEDLNVVYRHALVKWVVDTVTYIRSINFDLNRDGKLNVTSPPSLEMKKIQDSCSISPSSQILFVITFPRSISANGIMEFSQRFGFIFNINDYRTMGHELGHGTFGLRHPFDQFSQYPKRLSGKPWKQMDVLNLMEWPGKYPNGRSWERDKLRKYQWDQCNSSK